MNLLRLAGGAALLGGAAIAVHDRVWNARRANPPSGRFITVDDVRLHYIDAGEGPPLVLLHGLGSMVEELMLSGLIREASQRYRVIAVDRPGYGRSERPKRYRYGVAAQAELVAAFCQALDAQRPIVFGHSWGALVAVAMALDHPASVRSLVLASGVYFPTPRVDASVLVPPAIPLVGPLLSRTLSPLVGRAIFPAWRRLVFSPAPVPQRFVDYFPAWLALQPGQLEAQGEDAAATVPATLALQHQYAELTQPVTLVAGAGDRYVSTRAHTERLHSMLPQSRLFISPESGHMVTHTDTALVMEAIDAANALIRT